MSDILGIELGLPARFIVAFVLVLALIGLTAWLIRQFGSARASNPSGARNRQPRLAVLDSAIVDARRRLVLIRRDNVEHLILIGGPTDVVVEENIVRAQSAAAPAPMQWQAPMRAPIELEPEYDPTLVPYDKPTYEEPVRPAPARAMPQRPPRPPVEPHARSTPRPAPAARQDYDDVTKRLEAALRQPSADPALTKAKTEPRVPPAPTTPTPAARPAAATPPAPAAPAASAAPAPAPKQGGDVFASLEEEMASLLRPSERKNPS